MNRIIAVLSMLHEPANRLTSATRRFRAEPVLSWTLHRLGRCAAIHKPVVLCWGDQRADVQPIAAEFDADISVRSPRVALPAIEAVAAARRWSDGWRGGLLNACEFDRGFHAQWILEALRKQTGDLALLVDPSAALIDAKLIDGLIAHANANAGIDIYFSQAAPGLSAVILRPELIEQLVPSRSHPGILLGYRPDIPRRDPIATEACAPVPMSIARTTRRFTLDSHRQVEGMQLATEHLNGQLISTEAERLLTTLEQSRAEFSLPRDITLELTVRRNTRPIYSPLNTHTINRPELSLQTAGKLFEQLAAADDIRLTLAGAGDPLLHPQLFEIIDLARQSGVNAIGIETDLLGIDAATIDRLAQSPLDVISIHIGGASVQTYRNVMGVDGLQAVLDNLKQLAQRRAALGRGTPLFVPTLVKCAANLAEMETWYDHWLRLFGCAVINGPGDFAGQIPDVAVADMTPPRRKSCARIASRLTILSTGDVVTCEQDVLGTHPLGNVREISIGQIWTGAMAALRNDHSCGNWAARPLCAGCRDWHRP